MLRLDLERRIVEHGVEQLMIDRAGRQRPLRHVESSVRHPERLVRSERDGGKLAKLPLANALAGELLCLLVPLPPLLARWVRVAQLAKEPLVRNARPKAVVAGKNAGHEHRCCSSRCGPDKSSSIGDVRRGHGKASKMEPRGSIIARCAVGKRRLAESLPRERRGLPSLPHERKGANRVSRICQALHQKGRYNGWHRRPRCFASNDPDAFLGW